MTQEFKELEETYKDINEETYGDTNEDTHIDTNEKTYTDMEETNPDEMQNTQLQPPKKIDKYLEKFGTKVPGIDPSVLTKTLQERKTPSNIDAIVEKTKKEKGGEKEEANDFTKILQQTRERLTHAQGGTPKPMAINKPTAAKFETSRPTPAARVSSKLTPPSTDTEAVVMTRQNSIGTNSSLLQIQKSCNEIDINVTSIETEVKRIAALQKPIFDSVIETSNKLQNSDFISLFENKLEKIAERQTGLEDAVENINNKLDTLMQLFKDAGYI